MSYLYEQETQQAPRSGLLLLQCLVLGTFFVFALRFWYLQIHRSEEFAEQARENQLREEPIYSTRGQIMDRNGRVLAVNEPGYALTLVREDCKDLDATLAQVSVWTDIELDKLKKKFDKGKRNVKPFQRQTLVSDISFDLVSKIEANTVFWPGLEIQVKPRRLYPQGPLVSHLLGYVAEVSEEDLARNSELSSQDIVGKQGLELLLDNQLRGLKGRRQFEVDAAGRRLSSETLRQPVAGEDVVMSIDVDLQAFIYNHLEGEAGGVVVLDPFTGQVLALVTQPSYDNNAFTVGLTGSQWQALQNHPRHPLQNRVIQSVYPPGSVWKLVVAAAGLQERFITPGTSVFCSGAYTLGTREFRCWKKDGHGSVNLKEALIHSCDVYFYQLGERLGVDRMSRFAHACGFGEPTGIDLPHEKGGLVPTRAWKRKRFNDSWHGGENLNMAIGQGYTLVQPLQVARYVAALLNGGKLLKPNLLANAPSTEQGDLHLNEEHRKLILQAMEDTVQRGTATSIRRTDVHIGGKTGTAQVVRIDQVRKKVEDMPYRTRDHAWLATWGQRDDKAYVVVALKEHGGHGGSAVGPLVRDIYDYLFR